MPITSERIDVLLVQRGEAIDIEKARQIIMAGEVLVNNQIIDKSGKLVPIDSVIALRGSCPYVSRGGYKLQKALDVFNINVNGKIAIDIGSATGGFTDCLLQNGAIFVYSVDVGYGQLDWKLRNDHRVCVLEKTNIRYVKQEQFERKIDVAVIDVSFISLGKVIPVIISLLTGNADIIALIKPQFEAEKRFILKGGVVKDPNIHKGIISNICHLATQNHLIVKDITYSPIKGPSGNIEYLIWLQKSDKAGSCLPDDIIDNIVNEAYNALNN